VAYEGEPRPVFDARMVLHLFLTWVMFCFGAWLTTFDDTFIRSSAWGMFSRLAPQHAWSIAFLAVAMIGLVGVSPSHRWMRRLSVFVLSAAHGATAVMFFLGDRHQPNAGIFSGIAFMGYYLLIRNLPGPPHAR
jgi:hypothetical protein